MRLGSGVGLPSIDMADALPDERRELTGLRRLAALRFGDFDMLRRRVNVSRSVTEFNGTDSMTIWTGLRTAWTWRSDLLRTHCGLPQLGELLS